MSQRVRYRPFTGDETVRLRLDAAPLELVLCQVRWPEFGYLQGDIGPVAAALGKLLTDYPRYTSTAELAFTITPEGVQQSEAGTVYQWESIDRAWHVALGRRFVTFYCTRYMTYEEFDRRLRDVVLHTQTAVGVPVIERVAVRYVNRISDDAVISRLPDLVRSEVLGYQALAVQGDGVVLQQGINQVLFSVDDSMLQVRSGVVPPGESVDAAVPQLQTASWVLDLDSFHDGEEQFDAGAIVARASRLSDAAYDFFKWIITQGFIEQFGGDNDQLDS